MVELRTPQCAECSGWLSHFEGVREVLPHAGGLRLRLHAGYAVADLIEKAGSEAAARGIRVDAIHPVQPMLEDVFIAALESTPVPQ